MKEMKECELCSFPARMFCESDQARLCWDCDEKVHGANFLVARHSRSLLCHACQAPTPWKASGTRLAPTVSVCEACVLRCDKDRHRSSGEDRESEGGNTDDEEDDDDEDDHDDDDENDGDEDEDEDDDVEEEEDGENQVVPLSSSAASLPLPPDASSSSSEDGEASSRLSARSRGGVSALKRTRQNADLDLDSDDDIGCCSRQHNHKASRTAYDEEDTSLSSRRPWNEGQPTELNRSLKLEDQGETESTSTAIIGSIKRFQKSIISGDDAPALILGICKLSKDPRAVDLRPTPNPTIPTRTV
ncbi:hypothetical protein PVL29_025478 [Vitis rotundifolia]|uniref:B box-type domain-containing protein n=1 Tax=Vitis rotundifolia TaxID=103349 RepID=A0AA39D6F8_VITRO|nr:hypothetical protein PVL29_025478 [Vitis rotundifolia]